MKLYEHLVEAYLTQIEGLAVIPQLQVHHDATGDVWSARVDFLALDFASRSLQIVQVSSSRKLEKAVQLAKTLSESHRTRLEAGIREGPLHGELKDWIFRWRFFVRAGLVDVLECEDLVAAYRDAHGQPVAIVALEHVFNTLRDRLDRMS